MFIGANVREATNDGRADYIPVFLSETPLLFRRKHVELDVAIVQARKKFQSAGRGGGGGGLKGCVVPMNRCCLCCL